MMELPPGWTSKAIKQLINLNPKTEVPSETSAGFSPMQALGTRYLEPLSFEVRPWGEIKKAYTHFTNGDVLLAKITPCFENGKAGIARNLPNGIGAGSSEFFVCRPKEQVLDARYLLAWVSTDGFRIRGAINMTGSVGHKRVPKDFVLSDVLPLAPLEEQQRIADKLETLLGRVDACRDRLAAVGPLLRRFRQSVLAAATSGRLTEDWRGQNAIAPGSAEREVQIHELTRTGSLRVRGNAARVDGAMLYDLPESWAWLANHRLACDEGNAICAGPFGTIFKAKDFRQDGIPIIFLRHVGEGAYLKRKPGFMDTEVWRRHHQPYSIYGGELLVTKLGDPPGTACIFPEGGGPAMVTPDVMKMKVDEAVADARYLMHFFNGPLSKKIVEAICFGVTRLRIDLSMFKTFPIPLPPRAEQTEIVRRVETLFAFADRLEVRLSQAQTAVDRLTPALLAKAFRGELVPQDPTDEAAGALLQRLAAQPAEAPVRRGRPRRDVLA